LTETCLFCHNELTNNITWRAIILGEKSKRICELCEQKLEKIEGELCTVCGRPLKNLSSDYVKGDLCFDCVRWQQNERWKDTLTKNRSVYLYNDFMKDILTLFKFRGDVAIAEAFRENFRKCFQQHYNQQFVIVPIPLSPERLNERGFNQAVVLAQFLDLPIYDLLSRTRHEKQSKKNRKERIQSEKVFFLKENTVVPRQSILLIDDIYTTGSTLRQAAKVLLQSGVPSVSSLTLIRS
jgi:competence protein ComFC